MGSVIGSTCNGGQEELDARRDGGREEGAGDRGQHDGHHVEAVLPREAERRLLRHSLRQDVNLRKCHGDEQVNSPNFANAMACARASRNVTYPADGLGGPDVVEGPEARLVDYGRLRARALARGC